MCNWCGCQGSPGIKGTRGTANPGNGPVTEPMTNETYPSEKAMWRHERSESKDERRSEGHNYNY